MKNLSVVSIAILLSSSIYSQKKIHSVGGKMKVKGTYTTLTATQIIEKDSMALELVPAPAFTLAATIGPAAINAGIGLFRANEERKLRKASASFSTSGVEITPSESYELFVNSIYYDRLTASSPHTFQQIKLHANSNGQYLNISLDSTNYLPVDSFTRALVRKKKNLLIFDLTITCQVIYEEEDDGNTVTKSAVTKGNILFPWHQSVIHVLSETPSCMLFFPAEPERIFIQISVKEVNPFFLSNNGVAKYLEDYGENLGEIISGTLFESDD